MSAVSMRAALEIPPRADAHPGRGERGGIIDAITDHAGRAMLGIELGNGVTLSPGKRPRAVLEDAKLFSHGGGCGRLSPVSMIVSTPSSSRSANTSAASAGPVGQADPARWPGAGRQGDRSANGPLGVAERRMKFGGQSPASSI